MFVQALSPSFFGYFSGLTSNWVGPKLNCSLIKLIILYIILLGTRFLFNLCLAKKGKVFTRKTVYNNW